MPRGSSRGLGPYLSRPSVLLIIAMRVCPPFDFPPSSLVCHHEEIQRHRARWYVFRLSPSSALTPLQLAVSASHRSPSNTSTEPFTTATILPSRVSLYACSLHPLMSFSEVYSKTFRLDNELCAVRLALCLSDAYSPPSSSRSPTPQVRNSSPL